MGKFIDKQKAKAADIDHIERFVDDKELAAAISSGVSAAITEAISSGGAIETWADGRYAAKPAAE